MEPVIDTHRIVRGGVRRGLRHIMRDRGRGTTLLLLTALLLLMQLWSVLLLGAEGGNRLLVGKTGLRLEILPGASQQDVQELYAALRAQPIVRSIEYTTRAKALENERKRDPALAAFLDTYQLDNPFPDTLSVLLISLEAYDAFQAFIRQEQWQSVVNPSFLTSVTGQEETVRLLLRVTDTVRTLVTFCIGTGFLLLCAIIVEWVLRALKRRRREIELQQALGAPPLTITVPLATEMSALLLIAALLSMLLTVVTLICVPFLMPAVVTEDVFTALAAEMQPLLHNILPIIFIAELVALPLLALLSTLLCARTTFGKSFALPV